MPNTGGGSSGGSSMFSFSHLFARVFCRLNDGNHLASLSFDDDVENIRVQIFDMDGNRYEGLFNEQSAEAMRNACRSGLTWQAFFELVTKAFGESAMDFNPTTLVLKVTLKHERQSDVIPYPSFTSSLLVTLQANKNVVENEAAFREVCDQLLSYVALRNGETREAARIDAVSREEEATSAYARQLTTEVSVLESQLNRLQQESERAVAMEKELRGTTDVTSLPFNVDDTLSKITDEQIDLVTCRIPDPLRGMPDCKVYDTTLLRLIKTQYCLDNRIDATRHACDVLQPYSAAEVATPEAVKTIVGNGPRKAVWEALSTVSTDWPFNAFDFQSQCEALIPASVPQQHKAGALFVLAYTLLFRTGCVVHLNVSEATLLRYLSAIEASYRKDVGFHNSVHAADALQAVAFLIQGLDPKRASLYPVDVLSLLFGAIVISVYHQGRNTDYHVRAKTSLAATYCNSSVVELMHAGYAFELMKLPRYDIMAHVDASLRLAVERSVTTALRMTDPTHTESLLATFRLRLLDLPLRPISETQEDRELLSSMVLRFASDAYLARNVDVFRKWITAVQTEHVAQGAHEEAAKLTPSPFRGAKMKSVVEVAKYVLYVINFGALPIAAALVDIAPPVAALGSMISANRSLYLNAEERAAVGESIG